MKFRQPIVMFLELFKVIWELIFAQFWNYFAIKIFTYDPYNPVMGHM